MRYCLSAVAAAAGKRYSLCIYIRTRRVSYLCVGIYICYRDRLSVCLSSRSSSLRHYDVRDCCLNLSFVIIPLWMYPIRASEHRAVCKERAVTMLLVDSSELRKS